MYWMLVWILEIDWLIPELRFDMYNVIFGYDSVLAGFFKEFAGNRGFRRCSSIFPVNFMLI